MLKASMLTLGDYQVNCYILYDEDSKTCCVVDPGYEPDRIADKLQELGLRLEAILLTHGHFDHVGAVRDLAADTDCAVYLNPKDLSLPPQLTAGPLYYTHTYGEGDTLHLAGLTFSVMETPGHTPGSVCLTCQDALISGDTLFAGSCGRWDLPGGNPQAIKTSLARLAKLPDSFWVLPGHGETTTLSAEKKYNPYLGR